MNRDRRRRQWTAFPSDFPLDPFGTRLLDEFGAEGVCVWIGLWTAAKRARTQGSVVLGAGEAEAWSALGLETVAHTFDFTLDEFLTVTGHLKQTRRSHHGRMRYVELTGFEEFNNVPRTGSGRKQIPRSDPLKPAPRTEDSAPETTSDSDNDSDNDSDSDEEFPSFEDFHVERQREHTQKLIRRGKDIGNPNAYARTMAKDPDRRTESRQLWRHRNCSACKGAGFTEVYAPGSGTVRVPCDPLDVFEESMSNA